MEAENTKQSVSEAQAHTTHIEFMKYRWLAVGASIVMMVASIIGVATKGLNFGIDFTGGTVIELSYKESANIENIRNTLRSNGFEDAVVQNFGSSEEVMIRIAPREDINAAIISNQLMDVLKADGADFEMRRVEFVGPQVGGELTEDGALAVIYALFGILIYVALRFEFRLSVGAVLALVHDVIVTVGVFAWTQAQFDLTVLAAILAVIGYSLNDTIVVFDRVRENFKTIREGSPMELVDLAINQMLSRTIMTSLTTLLVLLALFFLGGEIIHNFAMALIVGIVVGTFSSTYVASAIALAMGVSREDLMKAPKGTDGAQEREAELNRIFLEEEAKREAKEALEAAKAEKL